MKNKFSTAWISSKQKRKQRKYRVNAPLHIKHKFVSAGLSKELKEKHDKKSMPIRKGDTVKIMRGKFSGKEGKVNKVNLKNLKILIDGITIQKKDGSKVNVYIEPSNVQIKELNLEDKERMKKVVKGEK